MLIRFTLAIFTLVLLTFISGCTKDPNQEANKLYTEATQLIRTANATAGSYTEYHTSFTQAQDKLNRILSRYPSSNIAVGLSSGSLELEGASFEQLNLLQAEIQFLADSERYPLSTIELISKHLEREVLIIDIAYAHVLRGDIEKGFKLSESFTRETDVPNMYIYAAEEAVKNGNQQQGIKFISDALRFIEKNEDYDSSDFESNFDFERKRIIEIYSSIEMYDLAVEVLEAMNEDEYKADGYLLIAESFKQNGQVDMAEDVLTIAHWNGTSDETSASYPDRTWKKLAVASAEIGMKQSASMINIMTSERYQAEAMSEIALLFDQRGDRENALNLLESLVSYLQERDITPSTDIALTFNQLGSRDRARDLLAESYQQADNTPMPYSSRARVIAAYIEIDDFDKAKYLISNLPEDRTKKHIIESVIRSDYSSLENIYQLSSLSTSAEDESRIQLMIVNKHIESGSLDEAFELAAEIEDRGYRDPAFLNLLDAYIESGDELKSIELLNSISSLMSKAHALLTISTNYTDDKWAKSSGNAALVNIVTEIRPINTFWRNFLAENGSEDSARN